MKVNLAINKEIITNIFSTDDSKSGMAKLVSENFRLQESNSRLRNQLKEENQGKLLEKEKVQSSSLMEDRCEKHKKEIFCLDNQLKAAESKEKWLKKKIISLEDALRYNANADFVFKEVLVSDPTEAVISLNDELQMYKEVYVNLSISNKESKFSIKRLEKQVDELNAQINSLLFRLEEQKQELKSIMHTKRSKSGLHDSYMKSIMEIETKDLPLTIGDLEKRKNKDPSCLDISHLVYWNEVIYNLGIENSAILSFYRSKKWVLFVKGIEMLDDMLKDKQNQVDIIIFENKKLNNQLGEIESKYYELLDRYTKLSNSTCKKSAQKGESTSDSMVMQ